MIYILLIYLFLYPYVARFQHLEMENEDGKGNTC
jgi:hypothetical protein